MARLSLSALVERPGWRGVAAAFALALLLTGPAMSQDADGSLAEAITLVDAGRFADAESSIAKGLAADDLSAEGRAALEFQRERMRRILLDFTLDEPTAKARVREKIPDLRDEEFARWDAAGLIEHQVIDGRKLYFSRAPSNLFRISVEARARRKVQTPFVDGPMESANAHHREVRDAALEHADADADAGTRRIRVTQSLTVDADAVPAGETVRAWIPYPRAIAGQQENIRFIESAPLAHSIAPESALQRTVYLEKPAVAGTPTAFSITYELTIRGQYHAIDPDRVVAAPLTAELAPFVAERSPHVVFTPAIREFSRKVVGDEKNPYRIAQKLYAAVDKIPWAGAREYSTITNISDYALHAGHADCGQQTLLLITLLRLNGIPARWQSGMVYSDGDYDNLHDWGALYLAPYGWVPMDVTTGRLDDADPQIAGFYLGGQDAYRIAFNDDYSRDLVPAKRHFRSETVDLQRGEAEWRGGNLYFDQWDYGFEWKMLPLKSSAE
ncbi:transglutaminase-like domain-containing protein [Pseudoxanthomonas sacheonensis]|uniref:Transglutaminase-like putative cysteine protease n=1 Tax=Pseudoxanthomonas sacheonensis TaxID=443615 RepID=A0ABU1RP25_9GAMM|nr:transglutaminase-like putative cysteine protease [Pseudoxanthomonas sacheonensis]